MAASLLPWLPAAANDMAAEALFFAEPPQVLSPSRLPQSPLDAPLAVTFIDQDLIRASGAQTVPELLRLVPGFIVGHRFIRDPVVAYHGHAAQQETRFLILVDGRPVRTPAYGDDPWLDLPLHIDDIQHIEVIRGPNTVSYGSNAFLGVVSIATRSGSQAGKRVAVREGEGRERDVYLRVHDSQNLLEYSLSAAWREDEGYQAPGVADSLRHKHLRGWLAYSPTPRDTLTLDAGVSRSSDREGDAENFEAPPHRRDAAYDYLLLRFDRALGPAHLRLQAFRNQYRQDSVFRSDLKPFFDQGLRRLTIDTGFELTRDELETEYRHELNPRLRYAVGASLRRDRHESAQFFVESGARDHQINSGFANLEWNATATLNLNLGLRMEDSSIAGAQTQPRVGLVWRRTPRSSWRLTYSRGTHLPQIAEEYGHQGFDITPLKQPGAANDVVDGYCAVAGCDPEQVTLGMRTESSGKLRAETIREVELGYHLRFAPQAFLDLRLFDEKLDRLIYNTCRPYTGDQTASCGGQLFLVHDNANLHDADIRGLEINLGLQPGMHNRIWLGYSLTDAEGFDAASVPKQTASLLLSRRLPHGWSASVAGYYVSPVAWERDESGNVVHRTEALGKFDAQLRRDWHRGDVHYSLGLVGRNLGNGAADYRDDLSLDPRWLVSFSVEAP